MLNIQLFEFSKLFFSHFILTLIRDEINAVERLPKLSEILLMGYLNALWMNGNFYTNCRSVLTLVWSKVKIKFYTIRDDQ